jgi:hypothetical protein
MIIRTEYANFGRPEDLLRYMQEENIEVVTVESEYWGAKLAPMKMTQKDVEDWVKMKEKRDLNRYLVIVSGCRCS